MMAFDRSAVPPDLDPQTVEALRTALGNSADRGAHGDELRDALCHAAEEARGKGVQAERLLVVLKEIWYSLPEVAGATSSDKSHALLQELVSRCIHEYYSL